MKSKTKSLITFILAFAATICIGVGTALAIVYKEDKAVALSELLEVEDGRYTLSNDTYTLTEEMVVDGYLYVPEGVTAVIDLNGNTLKRNLSDDEEAAEDGYVIRNDGTLTIKDSSGNNSGLVTGGYAKRGGAVYNEGTLTLEGGTFAGNSATVLGGGIFVDDDATLNVKGSPVVKDNVNGNVYLSGETVVNVAGELTKEATLDIGAEEMPRSVVSGASESNATAFTFGGGHTEALLSNGMLTANVQANVWVSSWSDLNNALKNASNDTIIALSNNLKSGGGSSDCLIFDKNISVTIDLCGCTLDRNRSSKSSDGHVIWVKKGTLTIKDSYGGGKLTGGYAKNGGGINIADDAKVCLYGVTISGNKASNTGGGIRVNGTLETDGAIITDNWTSDEGGGICNEGTTIVNGGSITNNSADYGGAVYFGEKPNDQKLTNVTITGNRASNKGGAVYLDTGTAQISGCTISNNSSSDGGAAYVTSNTTFNATNTTFESNKSKDHSGGVLVNSDGTVTLTDCKLNKNEANNNGGALWSKGTMTLNNCEITNSKLSSGKGGGVCILDGKLYLDGGTITGNIGPSGGSGIYIDGDSDGFYVKGKLVVKDNPGSNIYLSKGEKIIVNGAITSGANIGVHMQEVSGTFTQDYSKYNTVDPAAYFKPMTGFAITASGGEATILESEWRILQIKIDEINDGANNYIVLDKDWWTAKNDSTLVIPKGKTITLNLNGHTIDGKNLIGTVIKVEGDLILRDTAGGGKITGGKASQDGGGIYIATGASVSIESGEISNCTAGDEGGGIYNAGTLTISGGTIGGTAKDGGGVYNASNGKLTISGGTIKGGSATYGGGVYNDGTMIVMGGSIESNTANYGGGIYNFRTLYYKSGEIRSNRSYDCGGGLNNIGTLTLSGGKITANESNREAGGLYTGGTFNVEGAPYVKGNFGYIGKNIVLGSTTPINLSGKLNEQAVLDVAICNYDMAITKGFATNCGVQSVFTYNEGKTLSLYNGELYFPENLAFTINQWATSWKDLNNKIKNASAGTVIGLANNLVPTGQERIVVDGKKVTIDLCGHSINRGLTDDKGQGNVFKVEDGADLTIRDSLGTGYITGGYASDDGGGFYVCDSSKLTIESGVIRDNLVDSDGAGVYVSSKSTLVMTGGAIIYNYSDDNGGGIYGAGGSYIRIENAYIVGNTSKNGGAGLNISPKDDSSYIKNCVIKNNTSKNSDGGGISINSSKITLTITDTLIEGNRAEDDGGGIYIDSGKIVMNGGSLSNNSSGDDGGGIYISSGDEFVGSNVKIQNNGAGNRGGGIHTRATLKLTNCTVSSNSSSGHGGGIYQEAADKKTILTDTAINKNRARKDSASGGGFYLEKGALSMNGGSLTSNWSGEEGGGIYANSNDSDGFYAENVTFSDNYARRSGGGLYQQHGKSKIVGGTFSDNHPEVSGGGIYITDNTTVTVEGVTFTGNQTGQGGSAIYLEDDGTLNLFGATITGNKDGKDSAVYADEDVHIKGLVVVKDNTDISGNGGYDFYLKEDECFQFYGALTSGTIINIKTEEDTGVFTENYSKYNTTDPDEFFDPIAGYSIRKDKKGEAKILASDWIYVQDEIDETANGGTVTLTKDHKACDIDVALNIASGRNITIDLSGFVLDRAAGSSTDSPAITVASGATLTVIDSSEAKTGNITGGWTKAGGAFRNNGTLVLEGATISGNRSAKGGAVYNEGTLIVNGATINNNTSGYGTIYNAKGGTVTVNDIDLSANTSESAGGGFYNCGTLNLNGGKITGNYSAFEAGGIANYGTLNAQGSAFVKFNVAPAGKNILLFDGTKVTLIGALIKGGEKDGAKLDVAVKDYTKPVTSGYSAFNNDSGAFTYNENDDVTMKLTGGELYFPDSFGDVAVWVNSWDSLQSAINNGTYQGKVIGLSADLGSSGQKRIVINGKKVTIELAGHTINRARTSKTSQGNVFKLDSGANVTIRDTLGVGQIKGGYADGDGGGFYVVGNSTLTVAGAAIVGNNASSDGGGIYVEKSTLVTTGASITSNYAKTTGGGVYVADNASFTITDTDFTFNTSKYAGGAMRIHMKSDSTIANCNFIKNVSENSDGGAISYSESGRTLKITDTVFMDNRAKADGGAIYLGDGTIGIENSSFGGNNAGRGGAIFVSGGETLNLKEVSLTDNYAKEHGGAIYNGGKMTVDGGILSVNRAGEKGGALYNDGSGKESTINATTITLNTANIDGGGVYLQRGTLTMNNVVVSSNIAKKDGGGVKVTNNTTFNTNNCTFLGNTALIGNGGALHNDGDSALVGGSFINNVAEDNGGAIYNVGDISIDGVELTNNEAEKEYGGAIAQIDEDLTVSGNTVIVNNVSRLAGGGIYVDGNSDKFYLKGEPVITGNGGSGNVFLKNGEKIIVNGALEEASLVGIRMEKGTGLFTDGFVAKNPDKEPNIFFVSDDGYNFTIAGGEAVITVPERGEDGEEFIPVEEQILDYSQLNSSNWMAGISGERTLNEINFVGTHDSAMNNVAWNIVTSNARKYIQFAAAALFWMGPLTMGLGLAAEGLLIVFGEFAADCAKTQTLYINEQMEAGVRSFDLRLNNRYADNVISASLKDDGKNLWLCHGKDKNGGTFYALDEDDDHLNFNKVLDWAEEFLTEHPTETLVFTTSPETLDNDKYGPIIEERTRKILKEYSTHVNPSTGKPFIYWEDGNSEIPMTYYPKLKDIRGQYLIDWDDSAAGFSWEVNGNVKKYGAETDLVATPQERIDDVKSFYAKYGTPDLLTNADQHTDFIYKVKFNSTDDTGKLLLMDNPRELEYEIFRAFFNSPITVLNFNDAIIFEKEATYISKRTGQYLGVVNVDAITESVSRQVWETNFFDGLEYVYVTVKSGLNDEHNYPDRTYKLLKGTEIKIPYSVYPSQEGQYFQNWTANGTEYYYGDTYKVNEDVTFEGVWGPELRTPVRVNWNDADNADNLRASEMKLSVSYEDETEEVIVDSLADWTKIVTGEITGIVPVWEGITDEQIEGYRYEITGKNGIGYDITMYHVAQKSEDVAGVITWEDEDDLFGMRPESVTLHLYKNGLDTGETRVASAETGWAYDFGRLNLFSTSEILGTINERSDFTVIEEGIEGYSICSGDYNFVNSLDNASIIFINGVISWRDAYNAYGKRPDAVTLRLLANGEEIADLRVEAGTDDYAPFTFEIAEYAQAHRGEKIVYTIVEDEIENYNFTLTDESGNEPDEETTLFTVINRFYSDETPFRAYSMSLEGDICVYFYLRLTPEEVNDASVRFEWYDKTLVIFGEDLIYDEGTGFYIASCPVAVAEMNYDVSATLIMNGKDVETNRYSVVKYARTILYDKEFVSKYIEAEGEDAYARVRMLILAMLDYCSKAQIAFERKITDIVNFGENLVDYEVTSSMIESKASNMNERLEDFGLEYQYSSVVYLSKTSLRHFYKIIDERAFEAIRGEITFDGQKVTPYRSGDLIFFEIKNIAVDDFDKQFVLDIGGNEYAYSVMDYTKLLIDSDMENFVELAKATYRYNRAAEEFYYQ